MTRDSDVRFLLDVLWKIPLVFAVVWIGILGLDRIMQYFRIMCQ